jgi:hypothetical protein
MRNMHNILVRKPEEKRSLAKPMLNERISHRILQKQNKRCGLNSSRVQLGLVAGAFE